jgi:hypothetical protein
MPMKNGNLELLAQAVEAVAKSRGLASSRTPNGDVQVELGNQRRLVVRDRGTPAYRGEGVTVVVSRVGDGTFDLGETLSTRAFDVDTSSGVNVWRPENQSVPTYSDPGLAEDLIS